MKRIFLLVILITTLSLIGQDERPDTSVDVHLPLIFKILSLDRNVADDMGSEARMGVLFQPKYRSSYLNKENVMGFMKEYDQARNEPQVRCEPMELNDLSDLEAQLKAGRIEALYLTPLRAVDLVALTAMARKYGVRTFTGVSAYTIEGVAVAIGLKGDNPQMIINLKAARGEGADYSSYVLRLAKVIQ